MPLSVLWAGASDEMQHFAEEICLSLWSKSSLFSSPGAMEMVCDLRLCTLTGHR